MDAPRPNPKLDALSELSRKERRFLMATSGIGIVVAKTGLVPTKIAALGIEFTEADRSVLLKCLAGLIGYFLVSFIIYAADDYVVAEQEGYFRFMNKVKSFDENDTKKARLEGQIKRTRRYRILDSLHRSLRRVRSFFDFIFPLIVAGYSAYILWFSQS